jgi:hypothetical protein
MWRHWLAMPMRSRLACWSLQSKLVIILLSEARGTSRNSAARTAIRYKSGGPAAAETPPLMSVFGPGRVKNARQARTRAATVHFAPADLLIRRNGQLTCTQRLPVGADFVAQTLASSPHRLQQFAYALDRHHALHGCAATSRMSLSHNSTAF